MAQGNLSDKEYLEMLARELDKAPRTGADTDNPEGERSISISDTCALMMAAIFRDIAGRMA